MKYLVEDSLHNFDFWSGAKNRVKLLEQSDLDTIESQLEDIFCDRVPTDTEINNLFWFEENLIAGMLGYNSWEELEKDREVEE